MTRIYENVRLWFTADVTRYRISKLVWWFPSDTH